LKNHGLAEPLWLPLDPLWLPELELPAPELPAPDCELPGLEAPPCELPPPVLGLLGGAERKFVLAPELVP